MSFLGMSLAYVKPGKEFETLPNLGKPSRDTRDIGGLLATAHAEQSIE